jgi:D-serine deaminase-like pyridoxal phosphate-dependent protein
MAQRAPATPGDPVDAIETPALVVDLDAMERNLDALARAVAAKGLRLRPHAKSHKTPDIAKLQVARGAVGVCCQKVDEAAAFVEEGIADVLVTNEIVAPSKLARLAGLARHARIGVLVDDARAIAPLGEAARHAGTTIDAYVEVDVGAGRCGVPPGEPAAKLALAIVGERGLRFAGLHCYHGAAQHLRSPQERHDAIASAAGKALASKQAVELAGRSVPIVTGAGTGTWEHELASGVWNELQVGSYVFMDADYARNAPGERETRFEHSLFVLAAVMSVPAPARAICDAGLKAFSFDAGLPVVHGRTDLAYRKASDEHGVLEIAAGAKAPDLGERLWLIPGHCDPTVNLYDWIVAVRGRRVEHLWPVAARGALG